MGQLTLQQLPITILDSICDELVQFDTNNATLFAFSGASKWCCDITKRRRFESVAVNIPNPHDLSEITVVEDCEEILKRNLALGYVRTLTVRSARIPPNNRSMSLGRGASIHEKFPEFTANFDENRRRRTIAAHRERQAWQDQDPGRMFDPPHHPRGRPIHKGVHGAKQAWDRKWNPVAQLIGLLVGLQDVVFDADHCMPPVVLSAINDHPAQPRLHILGFWFSTFNYDKRGIRTVSRSDLDVAYSPRLYSLIGATDSLWKNFTLEELRARHSSREAVEDIVIRTAPNLNQLWVEGGHGSNSSHPLQQPGMPISGWSNAELGPSSSWPVKDSIKLSGIHFTGEALVEEKLRFWRQSIDFSLLRSLSIHAQSVSYDAGASVLALSLQSLEHLVLFMDDNSHGAPVAEFLQSIHPLSSISLRNLRDPAPLEALARHGTTLKHLTVTMGRMAQLDMFSVNFIERLRHQTPHLESLEMPVWRSKGDADEVAFYRAIGRLPQLRRAVLTLLYGYNADQLAIPEKPTVEGPCDYLLAEGAVDENLARSIFKVMLSANSTAQGGRRNLQYLRIEPCRYDRGMLDAPGYDVTKLRRDVYRAILANIARCWICDTSWSENMRDGVSVRPAFEHVSMEGILRREAKRWPVVEATWKRVWPCEDEVLFEVWESLPLDVGAVGDDTHGMNQGFLLME